MAKLKRVAPIGVPQHIIQRGNNRQVCFCDEHDMKAYLIKGGQTTFYTATT